MPATPRWHADLGKIRLAVAQMTAPFLDRRAIEKLFGLRARQANKLMASLDGYRVGPSVVVSREQLLKKLDPKPDPPAKTDPDSEAGPAPKGKKTARPVLPPLKVSRAARVRKARVVEELDALRGRRRPRTVAAPPTRMAGASLPPGVEVASAGELRIGFETPEDLLGRILGLAQAAAGDFAAFAAALEYQAAPEPGGPGLGADAGSTGPSAESVFAGVGEP
jgi:hypothetical protein